MREDVFVITTHNYNDIRETAMTGMTTMANSPGMNAEASSGFMIRANDNPGGMPRLQAEKDVNG
jgi:hypothetical protein